MTMIHQVSLEQHMTMIHQVSLEQHMSMNHQVSLEQHMTMNHQVPREQHMTMNHPMSLEQQNCHIFSRGSSERQDLQECLHTCPAPQRTSAYSALSAYRIYNSWFVYKHPDIPRVPCRFGSEG